jgi:putative endonuclease
MTAHTYMLECADGSLYVGSTHSLELRLYQHSIGEGAVYTRDRLPVRLIWHEEWSHIGEAFNREKQIQGWSRAKRLALVEERWDDLHELARKRGKRTG